MKTTFMKILTVICLCHTISFADTKEFLDAVEKAVPYHWKLGKTTCNEVANKLPFFQSLKQYGKEYGIKQTILVDCLNKNQGPYAGTVYGGKAVKISFYTNTSIRKLGLKKHISKEDLEKYLKSHNIRYKRGDGSLHGDFYINDSNRYVWIANTGSKIYFLEFSIDYHNIAEY